MSELRIAFIEGLKRKYGVNENLSRFLFDRWHVDVRVNIKELDTFICSNDVKQVFFPIPEINRAKSYSIGPLEALGIKLSITIDQEKRLFKDDKYGFVWLEKYNGMGDSFTGLFEIVEPEPDDQHLVKYP